MLTIQGLNLCRPFCSFLDLSCRPFPGIISLHHVFSGCWLHGQTRVYYNQSTTPLTHWPFRRQTTKRSEVSLEVNLMGWPRLKCLGPGSEHPTSLFLLLWVTRSAISAHRTSPSPRSTSSHAILIHALVTRFLPASHKFPLTHNISNLIASLRTAGHPASLQR